MRLNRRQFGTALASAAAARLLPAQTSAHSSAHADVAAIEHDRILAEARAALTQPIATLAATRAPQSPGTANAFYSELQPNGAGFRFHAIALRRASATVATLTAAYTLTHDDAFALRAGQHLYAWFVEPATRMDPQLDLAGCASPAKPTGTPAGVLDAVPLAELVRALSFLVDTAALSPPDLATTQAWFTALLDWLSASRNGSIAREAKDHTASAWLLLSSAIARATRDDLTLDANRHRFKKPTLRNQINENGVFFHEIVSDSPFRNTLLNFELLAGACQVLSTPFDNLWLYELEDGPGIRAVAALLYPAIKDRAHWPYVADAHNFRDLPGRRPALLFAGRAYDRPEYVDAWRTTPATDTLALPDFTAASFPIHEPLLWTTRAAHGL